MAIKIVTVCNGLLTTRGDFNSVHVHVFSCKHLWIMYIFNGKIVKYA